MLYKTYYVKNALSFLSILKTQQTNSKVFLMYMIPPGFEPGISSTSKKRLYQLDHGILIDNWRNGFINLFYIISSYINNIYIGCFSFFINEKGV